MAEATEISVVTRDNTGEISIGEGGGVELYPILEPWKRQSLVDICESKGQIVLNLINKESKLLSCGG